MSSEITPEGLEKLKQEITYLDTVKRHEIAVRLERAIGMGDISENAEYDEAKESQNMLEEKVRELRVRLASVRVVGKKRSDGTVQLGSHVVVSVGAETYEYDLVSPEEADPGSGKISADSPLGRAFMGKKAKAKVIVELPAGKKTFTIKAVK